MLRLCDKKAHEGMPKQLELSGPGRCIAIATTAKEEIESSEELAAKTPSCYAYGYGTLRRLTKRYGRTAEQEMILDVYRTLEENSEASKTLLFSGDTGIGKTSVAMSIQDTVQGDGGFFLTWRFEHSTFLRRAMDLMTPLTIFAAKL